MVTSDECHPIHTPLTCIVPVRASIPSAPCKESIDLYKRSVREHFRHAFELSVHQAFE